MAEKIPNAWLWGTIRGLTRKTLLLSVLSVLDGFEASTDLGRLLRADRKHR